jgi:hypothetical protein|tara:strand:- start:525 stop:860 length:336 start_codon:yes stop_codon:yes gene_type:complete
MGYIKLKKYDGSVDLLPADNIVHVSAPSSSNKDIGITYGVVAESAATPTFLIAIIAGADSADSAADLTAASRNGINTAIELAAGTAGPAIEVDLGAGLFCKSVTIGDADPS